MINRKPADDSSPLDFFTEQNVAKRWSHGGALVGFGFGARLMARSTLAKSLLATAFIVPTLSTFGFFSGREFSRRDGQKKVDELKQYSLQRATEAKDFVSEKVGFKKK